MKTDNSHIEEKLSIRIEAIEGLKKQNIRILDCFAGTGKLWNTIEKRSNLNISIVSIEKEPRKNKFALQGDNLKYLKNINLDVFDIIDLDSYGIPYPQLQILFDRNYHGIVIVTAIQSMLGMLPIGMLKKLGYTEKMIKKIPTLFSRNGIDKLNKYLYLYGVQQVTGYFIDRKNYFYFKI